MTVEFFSLWIILLMFLGLPLLGVLLVLVLILRICGSEQVFGFGQLVGMVMMVCFFTAALYQAWGIAKTWAMESIENNPANAPTQTEERSRPSQ